ncbi:MAG TPA: DUF2330 domain-containing protein [Chthonomonadaceae bacterium]|nr:DUF2330 domain-containing protein [Chthonomonadaceae bacterium]
MTVRIANLSKTGLIIYNDGREDLVLNVSFMLQSVEAKPEGDGQKPPAATEGAAKDSQGQPGAGTENMSSKPGASKPKGAEIKEFAWIVPVPSLPLGYAQLDNRCFHELDDLLPVYRLVKSGGGPGGFGGGQGDQGSGRPERSLLAYPPHVTGDYTILPLRVVGPEGVQELKGWLARNGFGPLNEGSLAYYAAHGWTFLAIKANVHGWTAGQAQSLAPLRISFATNRLVFPMKMASGEVNATLFVLTSAELPNPAKALSSFSFRLDGAKPVTRKSLDGTALSRLWQQSALGDRAGAVLYRYTTSPQFLSDGVEPSKFATEVIFP